jgi:catalase
MVGQLANVDMGVARRVANGLGLAGKITRVATKVPVREDLPESPALSILKKAQKSLQGKVIGCLIADGTDSAIVSALMKSAAKLGGQVKVIAPKIGGAKGKDGTMIPADFQLAGGPSVLFDCLLLALSNEGVAALLTEAAAVGFVHDGFAHLKVIGATPESQPLLDKAGVVADEGVLLVKSGSTVAAFLERGALGRIWKREPLVRAVY